MTGHRANYFGYYRQSDTGFPMVAWARAQEELAPLEPLIASLARELHVEPLGDWEVKARWPSA